MLQTGMSWCSLSGTSSALPDTCPAYQVTSVQSVAHGWVLGSQHCRGRRHIPHLPGMTVYGRTDTFIVPDLCARQAVLPSTCSTQGCAPLLGPPYPLWEQRHFQSVSETECDQRECDTWQPQSSLSELLQQLLSGLETIWFCRGLNGI